MQEILITNAIDEFGRLGDAQKIGEPSSEFGSSNITIDSALNAGSENPVQNRVIYAALSAKMDAPTIETVSGASKTLNPTANQVYNCGTITELTISNPTTSGAYSIVFTSGSTATVTTFPATILGLEQFAADTNRIYEINVLDNRAVVGSWAVSS